LYFNKTLRVIYTLTFLGVQLDNHLYCKGHINLLLHTLSAVSFLMRKIILYRKYCDVFDWRPSLLGNRSRNSSMDTLTTPVLLRYMVTNSGKASVSIVAGSVKEGKTIHRVSLSQSAFEVSARSESSKLDFSAVQFRQWDLRSYQCYSAHCNCNLC
jgi:hypothetical protein